VSSLLFWGAGGVEWFMPSSSIDPTIIMDHGQKELAFAWKRLTSLFSHEVLFVID
jgi:hypothetical protein